MPACGEKDVQRDLILKMPEVKINVEEVLKQLGKTAAKGISS